ncbi:hypothetical protein GM708_01020 [Vibrio cholerae]|nr:hypothetical protein [Vibrio cholerae]
MKAMTCKQLGGPCELTLHGDTADDIIKAQDRHLRDTTESGDTSHQTAHEAMKNRWRNPIKGMGWYRDTRKVFSALPEA